MDLIAWDSLTLGCSAPVLTDDLFWFIREARPAQLNAIVTQAMMEIEQDRDGWRI